jgi:hypothetical protein
MHARYRLRIRFPSLHGDRGRIRTGSHGGSSSSRRASAHARRWCAAASCVRSGVLNIMKGVTNLLRKSTPSSPAAACAAPRAEAARAGAGTGTPPPPPTSSPPRHPPESASGAHPCFATRASCSFAAGACYLLVRTVGECVALLNSSSCWMVILQSVKFFKLLFGWSFEVSYLLFLVGLMA